jgi:TIR domain
LKLLAILVLLALVVGLIRLVVWLIRVLVRYIRSRTQKRRRPAPVGARCDVFLSYATPDRSTAQAVAMALSKSGWSVWWDRTIPPGYVFDEVIQTALDSAKCVVVLWSRASVSSDWVKTEASEGAKRRILVPAMIEEVTIPLEFRRIQAASLVDWHASPSHAGFRGLLDSLAKLVDTSPSLPRENIHRDR